MAMKPITITIPVDLDEAAATEARRLGISKSELIRRGLDAVLPAREKSSGRNLWVELAGFAEDMEPVGPGEIDRILYDG